MTLDEQREQLKATLSPLFANADHVKKYPSDSAVPPCIVIEAPFINFPENTNQLGTVGWTITIMAPRQATKPVQQLLESELEICLGGLRKGAGIQFVIDSSDPADVEFKGYEVPAYQITGRSPYQNC